MSTKKSKHSRPVKFMPPAAATHAAAIRAALVAAAAATAVPAATIAAAPAPAAAPATNTTNNTPAASTPDTVVAALEAAFAAVRDLAARRLEAKLSIARLNGVARELKELLKVMSVYGV